MRRKESKRKIASMDKMMISMLVMKTAALFVVVVEPTFEMAAVDDAPLIVRRIEEEETS